MNQEKIGNFIKEVRKKEEFVQLKRQLKNKKKRGINSRKICFEIWGYISSCK